MADLWAADLQTDAIAALEASNTFWSSIPFTYLFIGHALFCTLSGSDFKDRWLVHLLVSRAESREPTTPAHTT